MEIIMKRLHYIFVTLTIIWMAVIFIFSSQNGETSSNTSGKVVDVVLDISVPDFDNYSEAKQNEILGVVSLIVRKGAHFTEFAILGFLCLSTLITKKMKHCHNKSEYYSLFKNNFLRLCLYSSIFTCFYAITDEFHQSFVANRAPAFLDVCIDTSGGLTGISISCILIYLFSKKFTKQK